MYNWNTFCMNFSSKKWDFHQSNSQICCSGLYTHHILRGCICSFLVRSVLGMSEHKSTSQFWWVVAAAFYWHGTVSEVPQNVRGKCLGSVKSERHEIDSIIRCWWVIQSQFWQRRVWPFPADSPTNTLGLKINGVFHCRLWPVLQHYPPFTALLNLHESSKVWIIKIATFGLISGIATPFL